MLTCIIYCFHLLTLELVRSPEKPLRLVGLTVTALTCLVISLSA